MKSNSGMAWVAVVIAIFALGAALFYNPVAEEAAPDSGAAGSRYPNGITVGKVDQSPTNVALFRTGTCNAAMATTLAATSSAAATCTVTGVASGDIVSVALPQAGASAAAFGGFLVSGTKATTDTITFSIFNGTGAATSSFPLATTSVQYQVWRTQ